jgi:hypothetical protein
MIAKTIKRGIINLDTIFFFFFFKKKVLWKDKLETSLYAINDLIEAYEEDILEFN